MANDFLHVVDAVLNAYAILSPEAAVDLQTHAIRGVKVLDFGQGDCNAVLDDQGKAVVLFDLGGGKHTGSRTHPWHAAWNAHPCKDKVLDASLKPTVVLSHWDGDHYSTAWYITNAAKLTTKTVPAAAPVVNDLPWLVPRQCKHPSKLEFVAQLTKVRCWPNGAAHRFNLDATTDLFVEACSGSGGEYDPNLDGLAVRVDRVKAGADPDVDANVVARIVLPGDAPYQFIPSCKAGPPTKVTGMLAFHHGSETHLDADAIQAMPVAMDLTATIGYTFGLKPDGSRCYGHPSKAAIAEYEKPAKGWTTKVHPSGGFTNWPPDPGDTGIVPSNRADQTLPLTAAPVVIPISLRRKKKTN